MAYSVKKREFENSEWIFAGDELLKTAEQISTIDGAMWIWPVFYTRAYMRKEFELEEVCTVNASFLCDNEFDLFINGTPVSVNRNSFSGDVTQYLKKGTNRINVRAYQSNDDRYITSAFIGKLEGEGFTLITDKSWLSYNPVTFWKNEEPDNWQTFTPINAMTLECTMHPRLFKHSLYIRKSFNIKKRVEKAVIHICAQGAAETYVNGVRTDSEMFSDGICRDAKEYRTIDITALIREGDNVFGALTGNTWLNSESHSSVYMNRNMLIAEMEILYCDGEYELIGSDRSWKCALSPFTDNDLQFGERYDARLEIDDWCSAELDDSRWASVESVPRSFDRREFIERNYPPVYIIRKVAPQKTTVNGNRIIYDFGENCAGRYTLKLKNTKAGQEIKISMCERLNEFGEFIVGIYSPVYLNWDATRNDRSRGCMRNFDFYTCKGAEEEIYEPRFAFTGFRYLCIEGASDIAQIEDITMNVMHNDLECTGAVASDNELVNRLYDMTLRTWYGNVVNGPMDCPTREKNYWTGDMHFFCATACYLTDNDDFLARWTHLGRKMCEQVYGWGDEKYIIPWTLYQFYRDKNVLQECYEGIVAYARDRTACAVNNLPQDSSNTNFSDWLAPDGFVLDNYFFSCCFYCYMLKIVAQIAEVLGDYKTADEFTALIGPSVNAFNKRFMDETKDEYFPCCQASLVLPLAFGLVPVHRERILAQKLNERVLKDGHIKTGFAGTRFLLGVLCDYGYSDTAAMLLLREEYPSWKHMIRGLTTMPETWLGIDDRSEEESISMNHFTFGSVVGWMFEYLGGIRYRESTPGFAHVVLRPTFIKELGSFKAKLKTVNGDISVKWVIEGKKAIYTFSAERNVTLILPDGKVTAYPKGQHTVTVALG